MNLPSLNPNLKYSPFDLHLLSFTSSNSIDIDIEVIWKMWT